MKCLVSRHAEEEMARRQIPREWLAMVLEHPQQRVPQPGGKEILQSRLEAEDGKMGSPQELVKTGKSIDVQHLAISGPAVLR